MNELIRLLAEQAGYYLYDLTETHECKTVETDSTDEWITLEKFAELIVLECVYAAVQKDAGMAYTADVAGYMAAGRLTAARMIKEHFGVKEQTPSQRMADAGYTRRPKAWTKEDEE